MMPDSRNAPMQKMPMPMPHYPYGPPPNMANKMGPEAGQMAYNPYMGNPAMMMNNNGNQMYNPNMIAYRMPMPPPTAPSDANKPDDAKSR